MENTEFLSRQFLGNPVSGYLLSLCIFVLASLCLKLVKDLVIRKIKGPREKTDGKVYGFLIQQIDSELLPAFYFTAWYFSIAALIMPLPVAQGLKAFWLIFLCWKLIRMLLSVFAFLLEEIWMPRQPAALHQGASKSILGLIRIAVWGFGLIFVLDNLGVNITAVAAGLGITGIAVAFAAQAILGDLFNYFVIFFDRPFEEGDFVTLDDFKGTIERIGIKSTRLRSLDGELIVISNSNLTNARLRNYKHMAERRISFSLGVIYEMPPEKVKRIPEILKKIFAAVQNVRLDRVHFKNFGDYSLNFEIVYFVLNPDYNVYMDIQQKINFDILETFAKEGIEFAYPTATQYQKQI